MHYNYENPIPVADGIYWLGAVSDDAAMQCNAYIVRDHDEAVLIDGGSRSDFPTIMMKILKLGIQPQQITTLVYHHMDPDLCGSMQNFIEMIGNPELKIYTSIKELAFLSYYIHSDYHSMLTPIHSVNNEHIMASRKLRFIPTPYSHTFGSYVTYDTKTKTLFSSDLFGGSGCRWDLFSDLSETCRLCTDVTACPNQEPHCPVAAIMDFHRSYMPCTSALRYNVRRLQQTDIDILAPQHGSIFNKKNDIAFVMNLLITMEGIGIDGILECDKTISVPAGSYR